MIEDLISIDVSLISCNSMCFMRTVLYFWLKCLLKASLKISEEPVWQTGEDQGCALGS